MQAEELTAEFGIAGIRRVHAHLSLCGDFEIGVLRQTGFIHGLAQILVAQSEIAEPSGGQRPMVRKRRQPLEVALESVSFGCPIEGLVGF